MQPTNFLEYVLSFSYSLQNQISFWANTYFTEGPYPFWQLFAGFFVVIFVGIIIYGTVYTILFLISRKITLKKDYSYLRYPNFINIPIRLLPFGYIITSLHTIHSGKGFRRGLVQEIIYTTGASSLYIVGYVSYYYIYILG